MALKMTMSAKVAPKASPLAKVASVAAVSAASLLMAFSANAVSGSAADWAAPDLTGFVLPPSWAIASPRVNFACYTGRGEAGRRQRCSGVRGELNVR